MSTFRSLESLCDIYLCGSKKKKHVFGLSIVHSVFVDRQSASIKHTSGPASSLCFSTAGKAHSVPKSQTVRLPLSVFALV